MAEITDKAINKITLKFLKTRLKRGHSAISRDLIVSFLEARGLSDKHGVLKGDASIFSDENPNGTGLFLALGQTDNPGLLVASMFLSTGKELEKNSLDAVRAMQDFIKAGGGTSSKCIEEATKVKDTVTTEIKKVRAEYENFAKGAQDMDAANVLFQSFLQSFSNVYLAIKNMRLEG